MHYHSLSRLRGILRVKLASGEEYVAWTHVPALCQFVHSVDFWLLWQVSGRQAVFELIVADLLLMLKGVVARAYCMLVWLKVHGYEVTHLSTIPNVDYIKHSITMWSAGEA
jgi:hypothetical protein